MKVEQNTEIGARIKQTRKALNLKQKDFARELNISVSSLSEIETGKYKAGIEFLIILSKKFNVNLYFVLFGEGEGLEKKNTRTKNQFWHELKKK
jgi:transcriptional regulator with XRE-family HTH domain